MELHVKISWLLLAAVSLTIVSCEKEMEFPQAEHSVNKRFSQSMSWNKNHMYKTITAHSDDYTILFMGDSHVGGTENLVKFLKIAVNPDVLAVAMAGDLTDGEAKDYITFSQCLQKQDSVIYFMTVGNHDLWSNKGWDEYYSRYGASVYLFMVSTPSGTDLYISLDSASGTLGTDQLEWLINTLREQRSDYRRCIVFTYLNFFRFRHCETSNPEVEELNKLIDLFTRYHVDMIVSGHDHKRSEETFGLTTYIVVEPVKDGTDNAGYLELNMKHGEIFYTFRNFD